MFWDISIYDGERYMQCFLSGFDRRRPLSATFARNLLVCILPVFFVAACGKKEKPKPRVPIKAAIASQKTIPVQVRVIGNVEAYSTVSIKAQINGMLEKVLFVEGQDVKRGQLLFTIDPRPFDAALRQAKAALARDIAQERFARVQARRYGELLRDGILTQDQYDQLRANAESLGEAVRADRASVDNAAIQVSYCYIRAPIDGRTGNLQVKQGNLVKANDLPVLVTINKINPIYVTFSVPEKELAEIRKFMVRGTLKVEAIIPNQTGPAETGVLSFVDNAVDTATGTIKIKGTFANEGRRLWPGQFVNVVLTLTSLPNAVVVPTQAVQAGQQGQYVFLVKADRTVESRPVITGEVFNGETVVERGIRPGETVVTDGHLQLVPGARVEIKPDTPKKVSRP
jgi:membrane fusion protein, multidrug efflux system